MREQSKRMRSKSALTFDESTHERVNE